MAVLSYTNGEKNLWHTKDATEVLSVLYSHEEGLGGKEAVLRLKEYGTNTLIEARPVGLFTIFVRQFQSPLIYILFIASATVFFMGEVIDGSIIVAVLIFNAILGTIQEGKAQNTLQALKRFIETRATVIRDGKELIIPDKEVVVGDIIVLSEGEKIPADARVFFANNLKVDEASMTGESLPVQKIIEVISIQALSTSDQKNMVFKGTHIVSGNGKAIVVSTGMNTVIGKIVIPTIEPNMPDAGQTSV